MNMPKPMPNPSEDGLENTRLRPIDEAYTRNFTEWEIKDQEGAAVVEENPSDLLNQEGVVVAERRPSVDLPEEIVKKIETGARGFFENFIKHAFDEWISMADESSRKDQIEIILSRKSFIIGLNSSLWDASWFIDLTPQEKGRARDLFSKTLEGFIVKELKTPKTLKEDLLNEFYQKIHKKLV